MKKRTFKEDYEMAIHNLYCYSKNYDMSEPKPEYVKEWRAAREQVGYFECIAQMNGIQIH